MRRSLAVGLVVLSACRLSFDATRSDTASGDAASGDGVSGDGNQTGDGGPDAPRACAFDMCDGFEGGSFDARWTIDTGITIDTTQAHSGTASMRAHINTTSPNTDGIALIRESQSLTSTTGPLWIRAWVRLSALPTGSNAISLMLAGRPGSGGLYVFAFSNQTHIYTEYTTSSTTTNTAMPVNTWFCLVWSFVRSTTSSGTMTLTSPVLPTLTTTDVTEDSPPMSVLSFGINLDAPGANVTQPPLDWWFDDIIIGTSPVTCAD